MTSGSADETPEPGAVATNSSPRVWIAAGVVAAVFVALFWHILAVRFHYYLEAPRYSHCLLLPVVAALWIYDRADSLSTVPRSVAARGLVALVAGVVVYDYGRLINMNLLQHAGMLVSLVGLVWTLLGPAVLRALAFPLGYLVMMIPLPKTWDDAITLPLQNFATRIAQTFFEALGWIVVREGNVLQLPRIKLLVEEGCSGVHSLYALLALAVAWVFFVERPIWLRVVLVASAVPIAVAANSIRVAATGVLAYQVDPSYAQGLSHQMAGMMVFAIGVALLLGLDWCLKPDAPYTETDDARAV